MFRTLTLDADNSLVETTDDLTAVFPPASGELRWVAVTDPSDADLKLLGQRFGFHSLALEDCAHLDQRPKLEAFGDHTFLVIQSFGTKAETARVRGAELLVSAPRSGEPSETGIDMEQLELHAFLGERYLVTVHSGPIAPVEDVWQRARRNPAQLKSGMDFVYYLLADGLVDEGFPLLDCIADEIEALEDRILARPRRPDFARLLDLKRTLVGLRRNITAQRDMMVLLSRRGDPRVSERAALHFRDVHDHLTRLGESIETQRELLGGTLDAYFTAVAHRSSEVMQYLTVLSSVFLPLAFIVGFFGQNFSWLPGISGWTESKALSWVMLAACILVPLVMVLWFKRKGWLGRT